MIFIFLILFLFVYLFNCLYNSADQIENNILSVCLLIRGVSDLAQLLISNNHYQLINYTQNHQLPLFRYKSQIENRINTFLIAVLYPLLDKLGEPVISISQVVYLAWFSLV